MSDDEHIERSPVEARQAHKAPMVRRVLTISLIVAGLALAMLAFLLTQAPAGGF